MKKILLFALAFISLATTSSAQSSKVYETHTVKSKILGMERHYSVYLPAGYDENDCSYPVLYLLHGHGDNHTGWVQFGQVQRIADKAIAEGKATPMIIVMPDADTVHKGYFNLPDGSYNYEDFFMKELIPHIEKTYRARPEKRYRAVSGLSMGGGGALFYTLHHPEMFAAAAPLSAVSGRWTVEQMKGMVDMSKIPADKAEEYSKQFDIQSLLNSSKDKLNTIKWIRWYISCGDDDFLTIENSLLHILLKQNEIGHEYRVKDGGHSWSYWRMELPEVMEFVSKSFTQF
ncbi:alpha/beta hydrolase-fold protein [Bacteroides sp.]|uniref:alpha/beta hydrolase n=1 Tax=Bacteroides sp. TaxID=29523 RepID=UPI00260C81AB|nr:alpha/beta hydrolase-fold protein [Bacteroides sp.]MDD3036624.1 alpha/beta hydrolase-fold protein [Bacteroides sp.]